MNVALSSATISITNSEQGRSTARAPDLDSHASRFHKTSSVNGPTVVQSPMGARMYLLMTDATVQLRIFITHGSLPASPGCWVHIAIPKPLKKRFYGLETLIFAIVTNEGPRLAAVTDQRPSGGAAIRIEMQAESVSTRVEHRTIDKPQQTLVAQCFKRLLVHCHPVG
jgi:hypothetical protein